MRLRKRTKGLQAAATETAAKRNGGTLAQDHEMLLQSAMGMARGDKGKGTAPGNTTHEISGHETRLDPNNGKAYTKAEFVSVYGDTARQGSAGGAAVRSARGQLRSGRVH